MSHSLPAEVVLPGPWALLRPGGRIDAREAFSSIPELIRLHGAAQDPVHHAEGDVAVHTQSVLGALQGLDAFRGLSSGEQAVVALACLLHDVAKPSTAVPYGDGRIGHPGHARKGARMARALLWRAGVPFALREAVCGLVRLHEVPYFFIDQPDPERLAIRASMIARCDLLSVVARADVLGRSCKEPKRLLDNVDLFAVQCEEAGCLRQPFPFSSRHARVAYFQDGLKNPRAQLWDDTRCEVVVMSGLPGAGKDTWVRNHAGDGAVISLDDLREELGVDPSDKQGQVVQAAQERAKELLRKGEGFLWNATNVSRPLRQRVVELARRYRARVRIVYVESPSAMLFEQNRARPDPVPQEVIERLLARWDVPDLTEAHEVSFEVRDPASTS